MKTLSIVFSFRNEEGNIEPLVRRISNTMKKIENWKYELIFVNDDSTDNSENILDKLQENHPIKIINMSRNFGVDPCVLAGFKNCSGDAIIYLHTDQQDPPEIIPDLIKKYEEGNEIVHTVRTKRNYWERKKTNSSKKSSQQRRIWKKSYKFKERHIKFS